MTSKITLNTDGMDALLARISKTMRVRVGVLKSDDSRTDAGSNATVGLTQEFGSVTKNIPARSFIRMPLDQKRDAIKKALAEEGGAVINGDITATQAMERIGIEAEGIVSDAFETGGYGQWEANSPKTIASKGSAKPLIDTGELAKSISSKVV